MRKSSLLYIWNYFHQTTHHQKKKLRNKREINRFSICCKTHNKHSFAKLTINNKVIQSEKHLKMNVCKSEQDSLTAERRVIVSGSQENPLSERMSLSHQLRKIICFTGKQRERDSRRDVRGLCFPRSRQQTAVSYKSPPPHPASDTSCHREKSH